MIHIKIKRNKEGRIRAFTARNHGVSEVCAAVSVLVINTVNSIEALTDERFTCAYEEEGGYIRFKLVNEPGKDASLLLEAMALGLRSVKERYEDEITLTE